MKRKILFSLFLFLGTVASIEAAPVASIVLSSPFVINNLTHFTVTDPNNEPYTIQTMMGGLQCRQIPGSKYGYFNVNDATISSAQNNLIFTITYYDNGTDDVSFQYNAGGGSDYTNVSIRKTATNTWITATIALTDASLRNAQNNGADFRIGTTPGYDNYIRQITVSIGTLNPAAEPIPSTTGSSYSEFAGKSVAGYQVWFSTGTPSSGWFHWAGGAQPSVGHLNFEVYPDASEYAASDLTQTGFANLGDGTSSRLFNSSNSGVINKHFDWMKTAGIDGVALQRFINGIGSVINPSPAASPLKVKAASEANNRIFYVCYDISSSGLDNTWDDIIRFDWVYNIEQAYALTSSPAYATVNNKPVVELWGTGFTGNHPGTEQETIDLINFLKSRGCYVIGGVPTYWRTQNNDSKPSFLNAYKTYDMISPWSVGRFGDVPGATNFKNNLIIPDKTYCDQNNIAYLPVIFPGFSWSQWNNSSANPPNAIPRKAG
ncbi:MAG: glycoside hydrolase family 71/99-like protein, partial [Cytophagaceae bacterium]